MDKIDELLTRGVDKIYPSRQELEKTLRSGRKLRLYQGFDPTGSKLHIGHMVGFIKHRQWQDLGHEVIFLVGDGTGQSGDPSGKMRTRDKFFSQSELRANARDYISQASKIVRFEGDNPIKVLYNGDWLNQLKLEDILNISQHFTVQQLLERDMFQERIKNNESINLREFLYPLLQAYDSVHMDVDLELGGSDQTFNMLSGRTLMKAMTGKDKFVMTTPLLSDSKGVKIGKSEGNVIGLTDAHSDLFGKIMSLSDDSIIPMFTLLTGTPLTEIADMEKKISQGENPMHFKKTVARLITSQLHTPQLANEAQDHFEKTIQQGQTPSDIPHLKLDTPNLVDALVKSGLCSSKSEAKRMISQDAVQVDSQKITSEDFLLTGSHLIKVGPRKWVRVTVPA